MRLSCNGCRVLRKGCSDDCSIKPCLQWITSPEAQANVTVFLAKFYGRAGLLNLINAGPRRLRPAVFRSLLYEACGRIVNPIYGPVGLLWSGSWQLCQEAVECVLKGVPITPINTETAETSHGPPMKGCDIRHVTKDQDLHKVKNRYRFKRPGSDSKPKSVKKMDRKIEPDEQVRQDGLMQRERAASHESTVSHPPCCFEEPSRDMESAVSEAGSQAEPDSEAAGFDLELSLGFTKKRESVRKHDTCKMELTLD